MAQFVVRFPDFASARTSHTKCHTNTTQTDISKHTNDSKTNSSSKSVAVEVEVNDGKHNKSTSTSTSTSSKPLYVMYFHDVSNTQEILQAMKIGTVTSFQPPPAFINSTMVCSALHLHVLVLIHLTS